MSDKRQMSRAEARRNRALAKDVAFQRAKAVGERLQNSLAKVRRVLADKNLQNILRANGVHSIPQVLSIKTPVRVVGDNLVVSLEFVIAWTLLFPLFARPEIAIYLDKMWPGFILQMKDTFIAIVVEGPFPHSVSGHRGRRHGAVYNPSAHRHSAIRRRSRDVVT